MNCLMVDISGKVLNYDIALCEALVKALSPKDRLKFFAANVVPGKIKCDCSKLISLIPRTKQNSENIIKRGIKALEGVVNYIYLTLYLISHKIDILHFQWLPFLEICSFEHFLLKLIRFFSPKTRIVLTVHNLYPHNSSDAKKNAYRGRFKKIQKYIDKFILHLEVSKQEFCRDFSIKDSKICVIPHGVFEPKGCTVHPRKRGKKLNLIMYGNQSYYKGTDILVDALNLLPKECQEKVHTIIVGKIAQDYFASLKKKTDSLDFEWIPEFVPDDVLYEKIMESDAIVIPYREISQSGVLLLALNFERMLIVSNLPSFKETLDVYSDDLFFESGNCQNLSIKLQNLINNASFDESYISQLSEIKDRYLWESSANKTMNCYNTLI